jgi:hypothetical protein
LTSTVYTIGHSTHTTAEFLALLGQVAVNMLVDVRSVPRSRTNPQFNADVLPEALNLADIQYQYLPALGGSRHRPRSAPPSRNTLWRNASFRAYADYAATDAFRAGLQELCALAQAHRCALMCAETLWWRCHRRIIADFLLAQRIEVKHILGLGQVTPARITLGARSEHARSTNSARRHPRLLRLMRARNIESSEGTAGVVGGNVLGDRLRGRSQGEGVVPARPAALQLRDGRHLR